MIRKTFIYELKLLNSILFFSLAMFLACYADLSRLR